MVPRYFIFSRCHTELVYELLALFFLVSSTTYTMRCFEWPILPYHLRKSSHATDQINVQNIPNPNDSSNRTQNKQKNDIFGFGSPQIVRNERLPKNEEWNFIVYKKLKIKKGERKNKGPWLAQPGSLWILFESTPICFCCCFRLKLRIECRKPNSSQKFQSKIQKRERRGWGWGTQSLPSLVRRLFR